MKKINEMEMEELYKEGVPQAIVVCNFYSHAFADLCETVEVVSAVSQMELYPFSNRKRRCPGRTLAEYGARLGSHPQIRTQKADGTERDIWDFKLSEEDCRAGYRVQ